MSTKRQLFWVALCHASIALAAPDEELLGKSRGYPIGTAQTYFFDESVRVGSFSHHGEIPGIMNGKANVLAAAPMPMPLPKANAEVDWRWLTGQERNLSVQDYLNRQRVTALLVVKDGQIVFERYQYDRNDKHRFLSNSMAKTITALGVGIALREGKIKSLDERADVIAPSLAGTLYGEATVRQLLRMSSGAQFQELYDGNDDLARFSTAVNRAGIAAAAKVITQRVSAPGTKFNYASAETDMLAVVLQAATGQNLSEYLGPRLWQALGAEESALWRADRSGLERAAGNFSARARDWARLGWILANDGKRPDKPELGEIVPTGYLLEATDSKLQPAAFQPLTATPYFGYGYQTWLFPGQQRRFALLGVYGQSIFVDPQAKLVMVHLAVNATAEAGKTSMARERVALWEGLLRHYAR